MFATPILPLRSITGRRSSLGDPRTPRTRLASEHEPFACAVENDGGATTVRVDRDRSGPRRRAVGDRVARVCGNSDRVRARASGLVDDDDDLAALGKLRQRDCTRFDSAKREGDEDEARYWNNTSAAS